MKIPALDYQEVLQFVNDLAGEALHPKQVLSLAHAVTGAVHADIASIAAIGRAAARVREVSEKHSIKQVDRLLANDGVEPLEVMREVVPIFLAERKEIVVSMDWTSFDDDRQATLALSLTSEHGRATPLLWRTIASKKLKGRRTKLELQLLWRLRLLVPDDVRVTVLADRGFADTKLFSTLKQKMGFDFVIRIKDGTLVESRDGERRYARGWVPPNGQARKLEGALLTTRRRAVADVVCVKRAGMKDAWCLATSRSDDAEVIVLLYSRRFDIEHTFRDQKDWRFGLGLHHTTLGTPERRDRMLLILAFAQYLLTLLGASGEKLGLDRSLRANTTPKRTKRTHSLVRQGREYAAGVARSVVVEIRSTFHAVWSALRTNAQTYALL
jgi:hypothetical protein